MSWNQSAELKCKDQKLVEKAQGFSLDPDQPEPSQGRALGGRGRACAEAVRWARILAIQAAVKDGSYRVPAEQVADGLFRCAERHQTARLQMYSA